jgi:hypothetical protein
MLVVSRVTVYHGISSLIVPPELADLPIAFGVLGISFVLEGGTLFMAFRYRLDTRTTRTPSICAVGVFTPRA